MDISVQNLSKSFGPKRVIENFSAVFREGETTCVMGPSGCGKTTLLFMLMGLIAPDMGTVEGVPERKSAVFQEDRLCESFSAVANVRLVCDKNTDEHTIREHLTAIGLGDSLFVPVSDLSGGMRRRVALVRAVLAPGETLFLDEPFKGLDDKLKGFVISYVKTRAKGKTVVLVTHDEDEARVMGGNMIRMERRITPTDS
ncbi:MAG: ABC transporter ATP-binding protein [Clostridiales bacterium]|nr:ABC transporter ATP-binding protein [Clostridiales bacterium]